ncbi:hypothetical protein K461DRAFT_131610 [Myriangium duriaei CBS 260.36]|uniref:Uncharacterized protein n=1 Tax=Myriangium duriaei CBS 260.36 TaxID=1168546 RepID=A0A9P4MKA7_9PEZI|nr:hypothetical protein K461DRAFT_131610 [Myriangium duriaei CBS 260.36]
MNAHSHDFWYAATEYGAVQCRPRTFFVRYLRRGRGLQRIFVPVSRNATRGCAEGKSKRGRGLKWLVKSACEGYQSMKWIGEYACRCCLSGCDIEEVGLACCGGWYGVLS